MTDNDSPERSPLSWYFRAGVDPWQMAACNAHGAQIAALGFRPGIHPRYAEIGAPPVCAFCSGSTTIDQVRACRCNTLGAACPVHRPEPEGTAGEWIRVKCIKCSARIQLPADRVAFEEGDFSPIAVDVTGWARRNGDGDALRCPFHGAAVYHLEPDDDGDEETAPGDDDEDRPHH